MTAPKYQPHELANIFPRMTPERFDELVESVLKNGLQNPITLYEGKILDGVNRSEACAKAGVEPRYVDYEGSDPVGFVTAQNFDRRDLTSNQRAIIGARLSNLHRGRPENVPTGPFKNDNDIKELSRRKIALTTKTSVRSIARAKIILAANNAELLAAVMADQISLVGAVKIAKLETKALQDEALASVIRTPKQKKKSAAAPGAARRSKSKSGGVVTELNSLAWSEAKPAMRTSFLDAIGIRTVWAAMSPAMKDAISELIDLERSKVTEKSSHGLSIPDDLSIPEFLRRH